MKNLPGTPVSQYLFSAALAASGAAFLTTAWRYPQDARAFPAVTAFVLLALAGLDLIVLTDTAAGRAIRSLLNPSIKTAAAGPVAKQADAMLCLAGFVAALVLLGIEIAVPLYLFVSMRLRAGRSWASSLVITAGVSVAMWLLFVAALRLEPYRGILLTRFLGVG
jgi:hypothetical protein